MEVMNDYHIKELDAQLLFYRLRHCSLFIPTTRYLCTRSRRSRLLTTKGETNDYNHNQTRNIYGLHIYAETTQPQLRSMC